MAGYELVRAWKDPDAPGDRIDHPAGEIELYHGGNSLAAEAVKTEPLLSLGCCETFIVIASPCCRDSIIGTCGVATIGCCEE